MTIEPTKFQNVRDGSETFGFRMYDDYESVYDNNWERIPDDDLDVLREVIKTGDDKIRGMLDYVAENQQAICIGGQTYEWEQIKDIVQASGH